MTRNSASVEAGVSARLSRASNQNDWQGTHRSSVTDRPLWLARVCSSIGFVQRGQFTAGIVTRPRQHWKSRGGARYAAPSVAESGIRVSIEPSPEIRRAMKIASTLLACFVIGMGTLYAQSGTSILFIGNSFTFGAGLAGALLPRRHRHRPQQRGHRRRARAVQVVHRSRPGSTTTWRSRRAAAAGSTSTSSNKLGVIGNRAWDAVVMHGYSTLDADKPRDPAQARRHEQADGRRSCAAGTRT